ncbi:hypothetical protein OWV82_004806 [Melia azedarach]|uniref:Uncharacterized protein n=2 Tax=Melia azedarach TaxID=155640 RepID=A0ACC1YSL6_MELAZ|nr:hypothetical protein OWV82_004806 [Melia azedarach]KAJ4726030.1 hypothetical protein OWV82_004806 [Melia azedarach]
MVIDSWGIPWIDACLTMRLFWWQQLPLLLLIQLLQSSSTAHKTYAEALLACKIARGTPQQSSWRIGRYPCTIQRACLSCYEPRNQGVVSLIPEICALSYFFPSNSPIQFQENCKSRSRRIAASVDGDSGVPTFTPLLQDDVKRPRKQRVAAIGGGVAAALLVIGFVVLVYICLMRVKKRIRRSDGESSIPSPSDELERGDTTTYFGAVPPIGTQNLRKLAILELKHATSNFCESNIIGEGSFGLVYKGLLQDGSIVAIKRHLHTPIQNFLYEVKHIARVNHRHLVKIVGYCEENHQQLLVYDYIPSGNVGNHLYDSEGLPSGKLNMRQRLVIALGAAKGLEHLHSLVPPLFHLHFRTSNVLLDENLTPKVSDYGILKMVTGGHHAGSSSAIDSFLDPELNLLKNFSPESDVYSFGVFLLELISGREANGRYLSNSDPNLVLQAKTSSYLDNYIDKTLGEQTDDAGKEMMVLALQCVDISPRRPSMRHMVEELERIQQREIGRLDSEFGEEIGAVTLGSELFK